MQAQYRHRQLDYEQLRYTMLAFLVNTEAKLKQWTKKLAYEQDVQKVLNDYNVGYTCIQHRLYLYMYKHRLYMYTTQVIHV